MKNGIPSILPVAILALATGCSTSYMTNRVRDAADVFTLGIGFGAGAKARVGPFQTGLLLDFPGPGLRGGQWVTWSHSCMVPNSLDAQFLLVGVESFGESDSNGRGKDFSAVNFLVSANLLTPLGVSSNVLSEISIPPSYYTQIEVAGGLLGTFRLGFNPGELLDFLLGWFGVDIYSDDLETKRPGT